MTHLKKTTRHAKEPKKIDTVAEVKYRHGNSVTNLECACVTKSIIYIIMHKEKAPIYRLSHSKTPKTPKMCHYNHSRKISVLFWLYDTVVDLSSRNNFSNSGSFAKVSIPVGSIIPCFNHCNKYNNCFLLNYNLKKVNYDILVTSTNFELNTVGLLLP